MDMKTPAANAAARHFLQGGARGCLVDDRNPARTRTHATHGIERAGIVRPIDARLHDDDTVEMEVALQFEQLLDSSWRRRGNGLFRERKLRGIAEQGHVA